MSSCIHDDWTVIQLCKNQICPGSDLVMSSYVFEGRLDRIIDAIITHYPKPQSFPQTPRGVVFSNMCVQRLTRGARLRQELLN